MVIEALTSTQSIKHLNQTHHAAQAVVAQAPAVERGAKERRSKDREKPPAGMVVGETEIAASHNTFLFFCERIRILRLLHRTQHVHICRRYLRMKLELDGRLSFEGNEGLSGQWQVKLCSKV